MSKPKYWDIGCCFYINLDNQKSTDFSDNFDSESEETANLDEDDDSDENED